MVCGVGGGLVKEAATDEQVVFVHDQRLPRCDAPYGGLEMQVKASGGGFGYGIGSEVNGGRDVRGLVADTCFDTRRCLQPIDVAQTNVGGGDVGGVQVVVFAQCDTVACGIDVCDILGAAKCYAESFALPDGVVAESAVLPYYMPVCVHEVALRYVYALFGKEGTVVVVRHEANLLTFGFAGQFLEPVVKSNLTHLGFGEPSKREDGAAEVVLGEHPKEIGLVFVRVHRPFEVCMSVVLSDLCVVTCGNIVAMIAVCQLHEATPFDVRIAEDTRVGRASMCVFADEIGDDMFAEGVAEVHYMVLKTKRLRHVFGFHDTFDGAASFLACETGLLDTVEGAVGDAYKFIALLKEQDCRDGGVDATRHSHKDTLGHTKTI